MLRPYFIVALVFINVCCVQSQNCKTSIFRSYSHFNQSNAQCEGGDVNFLIYPFDVAKTYTWTYTCAFTGNFTGFGAHQGYGKIFSAVKSNSGWYILTVTDGQGCSFSDSVFVNINPVPQVVQVGPSFSCLGTTTSLKAIDINGYHAPYTFDWENGATTQKISLVHQGGFGPAPGVNITNKFGCEGSITSPFYIGTNFPDNASIYAATDTSICASASATLKIQFPASGQSYLWMKDGVPLFNKTLELITTSAPGSYTLRVKNMQGCSAISQPMQITTFAPDISIQAPLTSLCGIDSLELTSATTKTVTYQWKRNNIEITNATGNKIWVSSNGNYKVIVTDIYGCTAASNIIDITGQNCKSGTPGFADNAIEIEELQGGIVAYINARGGEALIACYNTAGSNVFTKKILNGSTNLDFSNLKSGIYNLNIIAGDLSKSFRLIHIDDKNKIVKNN